MGAAASVSSKETAKNEFMLQRQKPVNGSDIKGNNVNARLFCYPFIILIMIRYVWCTTRNSKIANIM